MCDQSLKQVSGCDAAGVANHREPQQYSVVTNQRATTLLTQPHFPTKPSLASAQRFATCNMAREAVPS